ncbi:MAG: hypothetical protein J6Q87_04580, partial [Clostridia bacterium]|nr:hypothetical protein [Clostridia bacterium]
PTTAYDGLIKYVKYQWESGTKDSDGNINFEKISGATGNTYTISGSDMGKYIRLVVRGRYTYGGKLESKESLVAAAVPKNVKVENTDNGIKVTWDKISGATQYTIYRSTYSEGIFGIGAGYNSYSSVGTASTNSYTDSSVTNNTKYKYKVTVTMNGTESDKSQESAEITASLPCQHTWDSGKETKRATCTETGVKTYTCSACKVTRTETIPAKGHNYTTETVTKKATCTEAGEKSFYCTSCWTQVKETIPALGHSYDSGVVTTPVTCENAGVKTYTCANCSTTMTETIKATGHSFSVSTVTKQPTCTESGVKRGTCTVCNKTTEEKIIALGHDFSGDYVIDKNPTYDTTGEKSKHCNRCGVRGEIVIIPKVERLAAPKILSQESTEKGIKFTWSAVAGVEGYIVFKLVQNSAGEYVYKNIAVVAPQTRVFVDTEVVVGQTYCYAVASMDAIGNANDYSEIAVTYDYKFITTLDIPTVKITDNAKGIAVTWNQIEDAESYIVYRRVYDATNKKWSDWSKIKTGLTGTSYTDKTVKLGTKYRYTVVAVNGKVKSKYTSTETLKYDVAPTVKVANASSGIKVTWTTVANAEGYTVYSSTYNTKTKKWSSWKNRGNADSSMTSWTDKNVKSGTKYKYTVRAFVYGFKSDYNKSGVKTLFLTQPTVKFQNVSNGIKVTWSKTAGAKNYTVYRAEYVDGKWSSWKNVGTCGNDVFGCIDKGVKAGVKYRYTVRAVNGSYKSSYVTKTGLMFLTQPTVSVAKASNGVKVSWDKVTGATSYTVYRSEYNTSTKKWSSWKDLGSQKTTSYKDKTAKTGAKYKYTVRAVNGSSKSAYKASGSIKR